MDVTIRCGHEGDIEILHLTTAPDLTTCTEVIGAEFVGERVRFFRDAAGLNRFALVEQGGALLLHEEHGAHGLGLGWTEFRRQRESSLEAAGWRAVAD